MPPFFRKYASILKGDTWNRTLSISVILFFIFLGDAILSFWAPNLIEDVFKSPEKMGLIISFSSAIGLLADMVLPQVLKNFSVKKLLIASVAGIILFSAALLLGAKTPLIIIFLIAMAVWGLYYEFLSFSQRQFVADSIPRESHSTSWALMGVFKNLSYFLGPLIGGYIVLQNESFPAFAAILFVVIGFIFILLTKKFHDTPARVELKEINLIREMSHWKVLFKHVWPIVFISLFLGLIDSTFWTVGAVFTETMAKSSIWGVLFLPAYQLPALFMGFVVAGWNMARGKKKMAEKYLLVAGGLFALMAFFTSAPMLIFLVFIASIMLSVSYPLTDAVYSDIVARMGRERGHMIGLSNSSVSLAYIVGPALAGFIAGAVGEKMTFAVIGGITVVVSLALLSLTPKKLRLPEGEIDTWED